MIERLSEQWSFWNSTYEERAGNQQEITSHVHSNINTEVHVRSERSGGTAGDLQTKQEDDM